MAKGVRGGRGFGGKGSGGNRSSDLPAWSENSNQVPSNMGYVQNNPKIANRMQKFGRPNPYGKSNPLNNKENHAALLEHIRQRMLYSKPVRDLLVNRFEQLDKDLEGFLKLDEDDIKRARDNKLGRGMKPTDTKLTLADQQLDDAITYLMSVFAPDDGIFSAVADPQKQFIANAFADKLNEDGNSRGYYRQLALGLLNMLRYNIGGWLVEWCELEGPVIKNTPDGQAQLTTDITFTGNIIEALDVYNLFYDVAVQPTDVATKGEYFATVDVYRKYRIQRMAELGEIYDIERFFEHGEVLPFWWRRKPDVRSDMTGSSATTPDWVKIMSATLGVGEVNKAYEAINYVGWLCPNMFGLSQDKNFECWRITVVNSTYIVRTEKIDTPHGMLPIALGMPIETLLGMQVMSHAERLVPLQNFASFLLNAHQRATRKALYGMTYYDPNVVPIGDKEHTDLESAKIPVKPPGLGQDFDIRRHIITVTDAPQTEQTLEDMDKVITLMQKFLPTDFQKQVADLQRATQYQAAATVQGGNRRNLKLAKIIEDQAMRPLRFMMMYNFIARSNESLNAINPQTGQAQLLTPSDFRGAKLEFAMADGLKALDKMTIIQNYKDLFGMIVQSQEALQQFDFINFISYVGDLMGDKTDINQFRIQNPLLSLPPQEQQQIAQLAQSGQLQKILQAWQSQQAQEVAGQAGQAGNGQGRSASGGGQSVQPPQPQPGQPAP